MTAKRKQQRPLLTKMANELAKALPDIGTPEREALGKEILGLSITNCWWLEYEIGKVFKVMMSEFNEE